MLKKYMSLNGKEADYRRKNQMKKWYVPAIVILIIVIFVVTYYFLIIRPNQIRQDENEEIYSDFAKDANYYDADKSNYKLIIVLGSSGRKQN